jgi:hypothetical protein
MQSPYKDNYGNDEDPDNLDTPEMRANAIQVARALFHDKNKDLPDDSPLKTSNMAQKLAQESTKSKPKLSKEEIVPQRYHNFLDIFDEEKSNRFPPNQPWDHAIDLKEDYVPKDCQVIPLSPLERESLDE